MFKPRILYFITLLSIIAVGSSTADELDKIISTNQSLQTQNEHSARVGENIIRDVFERVRAAIKKGITILGIEIPLDPLKVPILPLMINRDPIIRGYIILTNFMLEGLAGFDLRKVEFDVALITNRLSLALKFPQIRLSTKYHQANLKLLDKINIYGTTGIIDFKLNGFDTDFAISLNTIPKLQLKNLFLNITLPQISVKITGLYNDERMSDIISRQMTDTLQTLAVEEHTRVNKLIKGAADKLIDDVLNPCLDGLKIEDIIAIIKGEKKFCEKDVEEVLVMLTENVVDTMGIDTDCLNDINKCKMD